MKTIEVNQHNLPLLKARLAVPAYDRESVQSGIVHIGVGGFHRAHQAFFTDEILRDEKMKEWGICGICLLERDKKMFDVLHKQDGLYTLMVKNENSIEARIIGSIVEYYYAPEDPAKVIQKLADPSIKIITLTITEGGYNFDAASGRFKMEETDVQWDLKHPESPRTVFGYLTAALKIRREKNLSVTIQSCDNIQHNGDVAKRMLLSFIKEAALEIEEWVLGHVGFPNSMVDRITPGTTEEDKELLLEELGVMDEWPVVSEAFYQWVIEDDFEAGRPPWEKQGALFVKDVSPYEKMKIRLLNGGHSLMGLCGYLAGYKYIHEVVQDPLFTQFLRDYFDKEAEPILDPIPGVDLEEYKNKVIERFSNPYIKDTVLRIILESSAKLPKFVFPTLSSNLKAGKAIKRCTILITSWYLYLEQMYKERDFAKVEDSMKDGLYKVIENAIQKNPLEFIEYKPVFGDLAKDQRFSEDFLNSVETIRKRGILTVIEESLKK